MRGVSRAIDPAGTTCALLRGMRRAVARLVVDAGKYFKPFDETSRCALLARDRGGAAVARAHTWPPVQSVPPKQRGLCSARYNSQQFDGSLNLNVHFHVVLLDRGFAKNHHGKLAFHPPQAPWQTEIADVRWRVKKLLQRRGLLHNKPGDAENGAQSALDAGRHVPQRALIKALASCTRRDRRTSNGPRRRYGRSNANARRKFPPITSRIRSLHHPRASFSPTVSMTCCMCSTTLRSSVGSFRRCSRSLSILAVEVRDAETVGIEPWLIADALSVGFAQRLVRSVGQDRKARHGPLGSRRSGAGRGLRSRRWNTANGSSRLERAGHAVGGVHRSGTSSRRA